jgi:hypothetical protein
LTDDGKGGEEEGRERRELGEGRREERGEERDAAGSFC